MEFEIIKENRIVEIMNQYGINHDAAESIFDDELCEQYRTKDVDIAELLFAADTKNTRW